MRNLLLTLLTALMVQFGQAQMVINEIMYNPPESGTDFLEYIEFYNSGNTPVNLKDYYIKDAVIFTFPDTLVPAGGFVVICVDSIKLDSIFGIKAFEWPSGGLRNTDEVITLLDGGDNFVDSVHYFSSWHNETNGNGASLELCRANADNNNPLFWRPSNVSAQIQVNNKDLFGSPGLPNGVNCADYTITTVGNTFSPDYLEIFVGDQVEFKNGGGSHNVNGKTDIFPSNPESFFSGQPSSSNWTYTFRFTIPGLYNYQCDVHGSSGMQGTILVKLPDVNYPDIDIALLRSNDANGVMDSVDKFVSVTGVVYGVNLRPAGLQFTIIDGSNNGIGVFSSSENFGYNVKEGDLINVKGITNQFNGLSQILVDSLKLLSDNQNLFLPTVVTNLNEQTENQLIQMKNMELADPNTWTNSPLGFTAKITDGTNIFDLRIDNDVDLHGTAAPVGRFDVTGIGAQFDPSNPYLEGYQIIPRYMNDLKIISSNTNNDSRFIIKIFPNPVFHLLNIETNRRFDFIQLVNPDGRIYYNSDFQSRIDLDVPDGIYYLKLIGEEVIVKSIMVSNQR